jgi:hypothetical protein
MIVHELQSLEIGVRGVKSDTYNYVPQKFVEKSRRSRRKFAEVVDYIFAEAA